MAWGDYRSTFSGTGATAANVTANLPAGVVDGDYLIAAIYSDPGINITSVPAGWEVIIPGGVTNPGSQQMTVYGKLASSEPASWTWNHDSIFRFISVWAMTNALGTASSRQDGTATSNTGDGQLPANQTAPSMTTGTANSLLCFVYCNFSGNNVLGMNGAASNLRNSNNGLTLATAIIGSPGPTGTSNPSGGGVGSEDFSAMHFALLQSAGAAERRYILVRPA